MELLDEGNKFGKYFLTKNKMKILQDCANITLFVELAKHFV